jgi:hypothetical protein
MQLTALSSWYTFPLDTQYAIIRILLGDDLSIQNYDQIVTSF